MAKALPFEMKLVLSKTFPPGTTAVASGRYELRPIPTTSGDGEAVLSFLDTWESEHGGSHPEEEALIVARCLSLSIDARVTPAGIRVSYVDIPPASAGERTGYPQFYGRCDPAEFPAHLERVLSLSDDLARQFSRAAATYSFALEFVPSDPTFAFFLLVVAVECLSSQDAVIAYGELHPDKAKCERFCRFLRDKLPNAKKTADEQDSELFTELLKTVYYAHRSGFVHGGRQVSMAALLADNVGSSYLKHLLDGKETKTPGLAWFARVVRGALLGYLASLAPEHLAFDQHRLARLAFEKAGIQLKFKRAMERGQVVTFDDVDFR